MCNFTLPYEQRAADMVGRMTVAEKIGALGTGGQGDITSLGIPSYNWWSEATHVRTLIVQCVLIICYRALATVIV